MSQKMLLFLLATSTITVFMFLLYSSSWLFILFLIYVSGLLLVLFLFSSTEKEQTNEMTYKYSYMSVLVPLVISEKIMLVTTNDTKIMMSGLGLMTIGALLYLIWGLVLNLHALMQ